MSEVNRYPTGGQSIQIQLRWSDEDSLGHVNNARIVTLMEEARVRWSPRVGEQALFPDGLVVASLTVDYLASVYYGPELEIRVGATRIGTKSFTVRQIAYQNGQAVFDGSNVMVPLAADRKSSRALSDFERDWLEAQQLSQ